MQKIVQDLIQNCILLIDVKVIVRLLHKTALDIDGCRVRQQHRHTLHVWYP